MQPKEAGVGGGESREVIVSRQAKEMLKKLPPSYDPFEVKQRYTSIIFLNDCFHQLIQRYYFIDCEYWVPLHQ